MRVRLRVCGECVTGGAANDESAGTEQHQGGGGREGRGKGHGGVP